MVDRLAADATAKVTDSTDVRNWGDCGPASVKVGFADRECRDLVVRGPSAFGAALAKAAVTPRSGCLSCRQEKGIFLQSGHSYLRNEPHLGWV